MRLRSVLILDSCRLAEIAGEVDRLQLVLEVGPFQAFDVSLKTLDCLLVVTCHASMGRLVFFPEKVNLLLKFVYLRVVLLD